MTSSAFEKPIRLGIVGCGAVAQICHLKALVTLRDYDIRYLCDRNLRTAEAAAQLYGLRAKITDRTEDLAGNVDAAIVCVWPRQHLPVTLDLLRMGLDVLCEKPVAASSADAAEMATAAESAGRIVAVGQWCRCQKNMWILRKLLALDFIGEVEEVEAEFGNILAWPMSSGAYFDRSITAGGVMFDGGIHVLDLVVWLFGDVAVVEYEDDSLGGVETNGVIRGTLSVNGRRVPCRIAASWTHDLRNGIRISGGKGRLEARFTERDVVTIHQEIGGERLESRIGPNGIAMPFRADNPYAAQLEDFAEAIRRRQPPITPIASTLLPLKIIEAAYSVRRPMLQPWVDAGPVTVCAAAKS
ncbi:MAG TPA: Gfo/Idh/MocA family oxidoreductase [Stellaceae bacterium]|nr:Gfo/Idh/MocA family oxidoreductase [Stellaceae bacterium]